MYEETELEHSQIELTQGTFTFLQADKEMGFSTRLRLAISVALTPLTLLFLGRSIRVALKPSQTKKK